MFFLNWIKLNRVNNSKIFTITIMKNEKLILEKLIKISH